MESHVIVMDHSPCQLSFSFIKGADTMSSSDKDAGFCSGGDDDDMTMSDLRSPSEGSENSLEVSVQPISTQQKQKLDLEPRQYDQEELIPMKKRFKRLDGQLMSSEDLESTPFRPWNSPKRSKYLNSKCNKNTISKSHQPNKKLFRDDSQDEPLALVLRGENRVPNHPAVNGEFNFDQSETTFNKKLMKLSSNYHNNKQQQQQQQLQLQRNYKNMTRERRIEANARERTRVHTISAAFDTLRRSIPAYSNNQKLSKLSVLRIACSYIMTLSEIANITMGEESNRTTLGTYVDLVSKTIQTEGKLRKKKDD